MSNQPPAADIQRSAVISEDGKYRYHLSRWWGGGERLVWVMFNPSTADVENDDATIRKVMGFSMMEGYDGCEVVNLYAFRSRHPDTLVDLTDRQRQGSGNSAALKATLITHRHVVFAWGNLWRGQYPRPGVEGVIHEHRKIRDRPGPYCLGLTKQGQPRHPLMVGYDQELVSWEEGIFRPSGD